MFKLIKFFPRRNTKEKDKLSKISKLNEVAEDMNQLLKKIENDIKKTSNDKKDYR